MIKRSSLRVTLCIVLSLLMLVDYAVFTPAPAHALDKKSALIGAGVGAAAGAGIALAAPAIGGAIASAGGIAGIGTAIVGGVAAAGGAIVGAVSAFAGAIGAAVGAIGGWVAGIFASPLFVPALIVIGAAVVGYMLYKRYKAKKNAGAQGPASDDVFAGSDEIYVTPGDYEMSQVVPVGDEAAPVEVGDDDIIALGGEEITITDDIPSVEVPAANEAQAPVETTETAGVPTKSDSLKAAHDRYIAAYQNYTSLVTSGASSDKNDVKTALKEYREAYNDYLTLRNSSNLK